MSKLRKSHMLLLTFIFIVALLSTGRVYADDTSLGRTPEGVFPIDEKDIVMESEEITVDLEKNSVLCSFVFRNTGSAKNVLMGFPGKIYHDIGDTLTQEVNLELADFKAYANGNKLPVRHEKTDAGKNAETSNELRYSEYYTFTVPFKTNGKVTVKNTYSFHPSYDSMGSIFTGYVLKTGAMWKDKIGSAKVTFRLGGIKPYQIDHLMPGGFKFEGKNLIWERTDFEPEYDLYITYNTYRYSKEYFNVIPREEAEKTNIKIDNYKKVVKLADTRKTDELLAWYHKAAGEKDSVLAAYIISHLPDDKIPQEKLIIGNINIEKIDDRYGISCDIPGLEPASVHLDVSYTENGREIRNSQDTFLILTPGIEYSITYTIKDWMGRTAQKTVKFTPPAENIDTGPEENEISSEAASTAEAANAAVIPASNSVLMGPAYNSKIIILLIFIACVLGGFVTAAIITMRNRKR